MILHNQQHLDIFQSVSKENQCKKKNLMDTAFVSREECFIQVEELKFKNWIKG